MNPPGGETSLEGAGPGRSALDSGVCTGFSTNAHPCKSDPSTSWSTTTIGTEDGGSFWSIDDKWHGYVARRKRNRRKEVLVCNNLLE